MLPSVSLHDIDGFGEICERISSGAASFPQWVIQQWSSSWICSGAVSFLQWVIQQWSSSWNYMISTIELASVNKLINFCHIGKG